MPRQSIAKYLNPWLFRREKERQRFEYMRMRDGDDCARCRRALRFDLPEGHDQAARIEFVVPRTAGGSQKLDNLRLTHRRCFAPGMNHTDEVTERIRRKAEAALFAKPRTRKRKAA